MKTIILLICATFFLTACNNNNEEQTINKTNEIVERNENKSTELENNLTYDEDDFKRPLISTEKMLLEKEGVLSGFNYNEDNLLREIKQLSPDLTAQEYYEELLTLVKEDYSDGVKGLVNFDSEINVSLEKPDENVRVDINNIGYYILLDASGSMYGQVNGISKMEAAKNSIKKFAEGMPAAANISLRVYGHKGSNQEQDKELSCKSTDEVYNGLFNKETFSESLKMVQPKGWTPIALALESIKDDAVLYDRSVIYLVSDGIETCDGDPVKIVKELKDAGINVSVNIIGFDIDDEGQKLLKEISDEGNGEFTNVNSEQELDDYLRQQYELQQLNWSTWQNSGTDLVRSINDQRKVKLSEIVKDIKDKALVENNHLIKTLGGLQISHNVSDEQINKLSSLINERYSLILNYATETSESILIILMNNASTKIDEYNNQANEKVEENSLKKKDLNE